jgi:hypothetical protein
VALPAAVIIIVLTSKARVAEPAHLAVPVVVHLGANFTLIHYHVLLINSMIVDMGIQMSLRIATGHRKNIKQTLLPLAFQPSLWQRQTKVRANTSPISR